MTILQGYACTWMERARIGEHWECLAAGAFRGATRTSIRLGHNPAPGAGVVRARVHSDAHGLYFQAELNPRNGEHRRLMMAVQDFGLNRCSVAFQATRSCWQGDLEIVEQARLLEISLCGAGAYQQTYAEVVPGTLPPPAAPTISDWFTQAKAARQAGQPIPIMTVIEPEVGAAEVAEAEVDEAAPELLYDDGCACSIWLREYEPQALAALHQIDPIQAALRMHIASYLARAPLP
jgi:HK97 family phage prohead protease